MKKYMIFAASFLFAMTTNAQTGHFMRITGFPCENGVMYDKTNGKPYVDLGNGLAWAAVDMGSNSLVAPGGEYVMAEVATELQHNWGGTWRLPSEDEWFALTNDSLSYCQNYKSSADNGFIVTGNGQVLFMPTYQSGNVSITYKTSNAKRAFLIPDNTTPYLLSSSEGLPSRVRFVADLPSADGHTLTVYAHECGEPNRMVGLQPGDTVTVLAKSSFGDDVFENWQDGNTSVKRTIVIGNEDVTLTAYFKLPRVKNEAADEINAAINGIDNADIHAMAHKAIEDVMAAKTLIDVKAIKTKALADLEMPIRIYNDTRSAILGTLGNEQPGPAIEVTKGEKTVILYNPDKVNFINVE